MAAIPAEYLDLLQQKTAYEIMPSLVGSEMCIRDSGQPKTCTAAGSISKVTLTSPGWAQGYLSFPRYFLAKESMCAVAPSSVTRPTRPRIWMY